MITIKQQYINPHSGSLEAKDIQINIENLRVGGLGTKPFLLANTLSVPPRGIQIDCEDLITKALDYKRTYFGRQLTRLTEEYTSGNELSVFINNPLDVKANEVVAIMDNLKLVNLEYALVEKKEYNKIYIHGDLKKHHKKGSFVEKLIPSTQSFLKDGIMATLVKPENIAFVADPISEARIEVSISTPPFWGSIKCYDVYVRNHPFDFLEPDWFPDALDISVNDFSININTFNGGPSCGGGVIKNGGRYFITVITKDNFGLFNVNESAVVVQELLL